MRAQVSDAAARSWRPDAVTSVDRVRTCHARPNINTRTATRSASQGVVGILQTRIPPRMLMDMNSASHQFAPSLVLLWHLRDCLKVRLGPYCLQRLASYG